MTVQPATRPAGTPPAAPAVPDIVFEHLEEASFLAVQRRRLLFSPEAPRRALQRLDDRIEAHRDGLRIGGETAVRLAIESLESDDPWLVAAAARVWLEQSVVTAEGLLARLATLEAPAGPAWCEALRRLDEPAFQRLFPVYKAPAEPGPASILLDAFGWRGALPASERAALARSPEAAIRRALARHARDGETLRPLVDDPDPGVRERALWQLPLADRAGALALARRRAAADEPEGVALRVLGLFGEAADGERLAAALARPAVAPAAIAALLDLAAPTHARALLPLLESKDEDLASTAREAFESLLGPVPEPDEAHPLPAGKSAAQAHAERAGTDAKARRLRGTPLEWAGEAADEPMERLWRRALAKPSAEAEWLRREVPDGLFDGAPAHEARPGV